MIILITWYVLGFLAGLGFGASARKPQPREPVDVDEAVMRAFEADQARRSEPEPRRTTEVLH